MFSNNIKISDLEYIGWEIDLAARALVAALKSVKYNNFKSKLHCNVCNRNGYTENKRWQNSDSPDKKLSPKIQ